MLSISSVKKRTILYTVSFQNETTFYNQLFFLLKLPTQTTEVSKGKIMKHMLIKVTAFNETCQFKYRSGHLIS